MKSNSTPKRRENVTVKEELKALYSLILFNDDINQYNYVIDSLVEVCNHHPLQAEQCTLIAHHNGKCEVKLGNISDLKPMKKELQRRGLFSEIIAF